MPHHLYWYLRESDDAIGIAGTPYYVGISSGPIEKRRFSKHREDVLVPSQASGLNIVVQTYETADDLHRAEKAFIQEWGRAGIDDGGVLLNISAGGDFKHDPEWARRVKTEEGAWKRSYGSLLSSLHELGVKLPACMKRVPDHWWRKMGFPANRSKPSLKTINAFGLWGVISVQDEHHELYLATIVRMYELRKTGSSLKTWLEPGVPIYALDHFWNPEDCLAFMLRTQQILARQDGSAGVG